MFFFGAIFRYDTKKIPETGVFFSRFVFAISRYDIFLEGDLLVQKRDIFSFFAHNDRGTYFSLVPHRREGVPYAQACVYPYETVGGVLSTETFRGADGFHDSSYYNSVRA